MPHDSTLKTLRGQVPLVSGTHWSSKYTSFENSYRQPTWQLIHQGAWTCCIPTFAKGAHGLVTHSTLSRGSVEGRRMSSFLYIISVAHFVSCGPYRPTYDSTSYSQILKTSDSITCGPPRVDPYAGSAIMWSHHSPAYVDLYEGSSTLGFITRGVWVGIYEGLRISICEIRILSLRSRSRFLRRNPMISSAMLHNYILHDIIYMI